jgi:tetratricopeptide (TPR) repeat protein
MSGLNKSVAGISKKTFEQAVEKKPIVPKKDLARIQSIPDKILSDSGLYSLIKRIHIDVEKLIPAAEKTGAARIYQETKKNFSSAFAVNNAAAGCWLYGHWEKALWLSGKACLDSMADPDNLNNYAAYLTMIGGEHAAIPILRYLNKKYPGNSTVLNNIGQAWFGLGDIPAAKKFLDSATIFFPEHSTANLTLSNIYLSRGDSVNAIAALRRSLRSSFSIEKTAALESLGEELDDDDIEFDYPMEDEDPFGYEPFFDEFPATPGGIDETPGARRAWEAFHEATRELQKKSNEELQESQARTKVFTYKMADSAFNHPVLKLHNSNAHIKAGRKFPLAVKKKTALSIEEVMNMMAEAFHQATTNRLNELERQRRAAFSENPTCAAVDAANNSFMSQAKAIIEEGSVAMRRVYLQNKKKVHKFIKLTAYSSLNDYNERMGKFHEELWKKNMWIYAYTSSFVAAFSSLKKEPAMSDRCNPAPEAPKQTKQLPALKIPDCTYADSLKLPVGGIKEECNTCTIDESQLKYRQNNLSKGELLVTYGPVSISGGPKIQDPIDPSKYKNIECNKSGSVKVDRARATRHEKCTVSTDRSGAGSFGSSGYQGGKILSR